MEKNFTLIYLFSNFEDVNVLTDEFVGYELNEFKDVSNCLNKMIKKAPDRIVKNIFSFAKNYS